MNTIIYKYELDVVDLQIVNLPKEAKILSIQNQAGIPCLWAEVNPKETKLEERTIITVGTGHDFTSIPDFNSREYIGTYQLAGGSLIFHTYELKNR